MMILKCGFHKNTKNYHYFIIMIILCIVVLYKNNSVSAEVKLPKIELPNIEVPAVPQVPQPKMPEIKGIDTEKIDREIQGHAVQQEKNTHGNDKAAADKQKSGYDKIRDNKYIKHDSPTQKNVANNKKQAEPVMASNENNNAAEKKKVKIAASELLKTSFVPVMAYIFSKTVFVSIVIWMLILLKWRKLSIAIEAFTFFLLNIIVGCIYFRFSAGAEKGTWQFAGKILAGRDIWLVMGTFSLCLLLMAAVISFIVALWQQNRTERKF
ncbi:hypothetical protein [Pectinatus sottacetonis]|uniref:hypothetical protein n=1 Tax=Pectinatus sottacetonis TaxID=1002795 RepID=UPI0018C7B685|nr:hypothetical protein [Pectinatus sottacetonis]